MEISKNTDLKYHNNSKQHSPWIAINLDSKDEAITLSSYAKKLEHVNINSMMKLLQQPDHLESNRVGSVKVCASRKTIKTLITGGISM